MKHDPHTRIAAHGSPDGAHCRPRVRRADVPGIPPLSFGAGAVLFVRTRLSSTLGKGVLALFVSAAVIRWPWLVCWLGKPLSDDIMQAASEMHSWGWTLVLFFAKGCNQTGGTQPITPEARERTGAPGQ